MNSLLGKLKRKIQSDYNKKFKRHITSEEFTKIVTEAKLFDTAYYITHFLKKEVSPEKAIAHYFKTGVKLGYNPNSHFDTTYYLNLYPDVKKAKFNPLLHYILYGWAEGRNPSGIFDTEFYINHYPDVKSSLLNPLFHFLNYGIQEHRICIDNGVHDSKPAFEPPTSQVVHHDLESIAIDVIKKSGLFDTEYYIKQSGLKDQSEDLVAHYVKKGAKAGLDPNPLFSSKFYFSENKDVTESKLNPLFHYIMYGVKEGRNPGPEFDTEFYFLLYGDVKNAGLNPLHHYLHYGIKEGRSINRASASDPHTYLGWVNTYDRITRKEIAAMKKMIAAMNYKPLISVITPVYNPDIKYFRMAIESVMKQAYDNWELCLADDASTDPEVRKVLEEYAQADKRIKVAYRKINGHISDASNSAIEIASGDYFLLLDQDDEIPEHAMFMVAQALNENKDIALLYSDEDKIDIHGHRHGAYFKSDWNYDLFCGHNMISHLGVYKAAIVRKIGGFRKGYEGSQDYDLAHRFIEQIKPEQIRHLPHILYHWRTLPGSTSFSMDSKNYAFDAALRSLEDHLTRTQQKGKVIVAPNFGYRVKRDTPQAAPLVSIIIPFKDKIDYLERCLNSIFEKTTYKNYELILVNNASKEQSTKQYLSELVRTHKNIQILDYPGEFNYSAMNNRAVDMARGVIVGLLNNDIEVINEDWLTEIVSQVNRKDAGAVGAKLYFPNDTIQHAGIVLGIHVVGNHIHKLFERNHAGYLNKLQLIQDFSALTGACLFVKKAIYLEVGGLDEKNLKVAYNDVDFCLKLREKGYLNIWTPFAELYHHESVSRGKDTDAHNQRFESEINYMYKRWGAIIENDPYYNPNLSNQSVEFRMAVPPRRNYPWTELAKKESKLV